MAFRIAHFKVYYPLAYYCAFFSIRASDFDYALMCKGRDHLKGEMKKLNDKAKESKLSAKESGMYDDMRLVLEFYERGFEFLPIDIYKAKARHFQIIDGKLMPSLSTINGLGDKAAEQIEDASSRYKYVSRQDFKSKAKVGDSMIELMADLGILDSLPKTDQMSFEDFFGANTI